MAIRLTRRDAFSQRATVSINFVVSHPIRSEAIAPRSPIGCGTAGAPHFVSDCHVSRRGARSAVLLAAGPNINWDEVNTPQKRRALGPSRPRRLRGPCRVSCTRWWGSNPALLQLRVKSSCQGHAPGGETLCSLEALLPSRVVRSWSSSRYTATFFGAVIPTRTRLPLIASIVRVTSSPTITVVPTRLVKMSMCCAPYARGSLSAARRSMDFARSRAHAHLCPVSRYLTIITLS